MRIYTYTDKYGVQLTGTLPEIGARLIDGGDGYAGYGGGRLTDHPEPWLDLDAEPDPAPREFTGAEWLEWAASVEDRPVDRSALTMHPQMAEDRMTDAEFRCTRDRLGLTMEWIAWKLDVAERTVRRWEAGVTPIPPGVAAYLMHLSGLTDAEARRVAGGLDKEQLRLVTYRSEADYSSDLPDGDWPASWHRALCARIAAEVPGVRIQYWS